MPSPGGHRPGCLPASPGSPGTDAHSPRGTVSTVLPSGSVILHLAGSQPNKKLCMNILFCTWHSFYFCRKEKFEKSKSITSGCQSCGVSEGCCFWTPPRTENQPLQTGHQLRGDARDQAPFPDSGELGRARRPGSRR